ncbi:hypothetical protein H9636_11055 [Ureibacillus sp. Re31]|uniref:Uncharacterized protein n=1 Tax=Ureibacillus galli TaxID=2762222 RepID=A0ABR8XD82_9BACL|nr:hypothetical protein [Ureibacillus galli]MBD8027190.1 hypothetical protein [Ureibacillus galli]
MSTILFFLFPIFGILIFAWLIDLRRKKKITDSHNLIPNTNIGESLNYTMGDNRYSSWGQ